MFVEWTGAKWLMTTENGISVHPTATGLYPPETGWPDIDGSPVSLSHSCGWIKADGTTTLYWADFVTLPNFTDDVIMKWAEDGYGDTCHLDEMGLYQQGTTEGASNADMDKAASYHGESDCGNTGYLQASEGTEILTSEGQHIYTA